MTSSTIGTAGKDLLIRSNNHTFSAHCAILAAHSPRFNTLLFSLPDLPTPDTPFNLILPPQIPTSAIPPFLSSIYTNNNNTTTTLLSHHAPPTLLGLYTLYHHLSIAHPSLPSILPLLHTKLVQDHTLSDIQESILNIQTLALAANLFPSSRNLVVSELCQTLISVVHERNLTRLISVQDSLFLESGGGGGGGVDINASSENPDSAATAPVAQVEEATSTREIVKPLPRAVRHVLATVQFKGFYPSPTTTATALENGNSRCGMDTELMDDGVVSLALEKRLLHHDHDEMIIAATEHDSKRTMISSKY
ncbi:hypothetical protein BDR26DRAFT_914580 [Obelidium mucronatum]|nr:hypothetical protein BDR26DRAFT_914580 [Obelidium mucronatum]